MYGEKITGCSEGGIILFTDGRSRKVVFIAHCLLNQNAISDGTAVFPAAFRNVIDAYLDKDVGIVQLPCPELCCLGLDRGNIHGAESPVTEENTRIRKAMETDDMKKQLSQLVDYVMKQITEYHRHGFEIEAIIGANRSPNCGVETTSDNDREIDGKGLFMEELHRRLEAEKLEIPMFGIKASDDISEKII